MVHDENSRVKIPALLHFTRLGYEYLPLRGTRRDPNSNIFPALFAEAVHSLNPDADNEAIEQNRQLLKNDEFAERELLRLAITQFNKTHQFGFDADSLKDINKTILKEYLDEANGRMPA